MILGSHNTMSFLRPKYFWLRPFRFMARCQNKHLISQYYLGARLFDMRLVFDKHGKPHFAHGLMTYKTDTDRFVPAVFSWLNDMADGDTIWVRVINERNKNKDKFISYCKRLQHDYPCVKFFGGINKKDWKQIYDFGYGSPTFVDKYASQNNDIFGRGTGWHWDDIWPWIYARLHNKKWIEKFAKAPGYLMIDFIGIPDKAK